MKKPMHFYPGNDPKGGGRDKEVITPEPIGIDVPYGDKKEGGSARNTSDKEKNLKPGKDFVSKKAKADAAFIKQTNSMNGKGTLMLQVQKDAAIRLLQLERAKAMSEGRKADAKYFKDQIASVKKIKLYVEDETNIPKKPIAEKPKKTATKKPAAKKSAKPNKKEGNDFGGRF